MTSVSLGIPRVNPSRKRTEKSYIFSWKDRDMIHTTGRRPPPIFSYLFIGWRGSGTMVREYLRHIITSKSQQTNRHNVQRRRLHPPSRFVVSLRFLSSERVIWNHKQKLMPWLHHCFYIQHSLASSIGDP